MANALNTLAMFAGLVDVMRHQAVVLGKPIFEFEDERLNGEGRNRLMRSRTPFDVQVDQELPFVDYSLSTCCKV